MLAFTFLIVLPALALADVEMLMFESIDKDNDQKITQAEIENVVMSLDANKDTEVDKQEFDDGIEKQEPNLAAHKDNIFSMLDRNKDGKVDKKEIAAIVTIADTNEDGDVSKDEFHAVAQAITQG